MDPLAIYIIIIENEPSIEKNYQHLQNFHRTSLCSTTVKDGRLQSARVEQIFKHDLRRSTQHQ